MENTKIKYDHVYIRNMIMRIWDTQEELCEVIKSENDSSRFKNIMESVFALDNCVDELISFRQSYLRERYEFSKYRKL